MKRNKLKYVGIGFLMVFVIIQFFHTAKNASLDMSNDISKNFPVPDEVKQILTTSCYDCHSNSSVYPWYSKIQPLNFWIQHHIDEGKAELNFNEFSSYRVFKQFHKLDEIKDEIKEKEMPLASYTLIHKDAKLSEAQAELLIHWANSLQDSIKANYPADSLVNPYRKKKN